MKNLFIVICILLFSGKGNAEAFNSTKKAQVDSILNREIEQFCAKSGQVIIMDSQTGDTVIVGKCTIGRHGSQSVRVAILLAAIETGKISLDDIVDTGNGVLKMKKGTLKDHNWRRGGYGKIRVKDGFVASSAIANYLLTEKVWGNDSLSCFNAVKELGYGMPNGDAEFAFHGGDADVTPLQTLTFINAIGTGTVKAKNIKQVQDLLRYDITDGLGMKAQASNTTVAGMPSTVLSDDGSYWLEFCGYFPSETPKYSIIVTLNKDGLPASGGGMAGSLFKEITDLLTDKVSEK